MSESRNGRPVVHYRVGPQAMSELVRTLATNGVTQIAALLVPDSAEDSLWAVSHPPTLED